MASQPLAATTQPTQSTPPVSPDTPPIANPYDLNDPVALKQAKDRFKLRWDVGNHRRYFFELSWLRNVLYGQDIQWIKVDWTMKEIRNLSLAPNFPRAITNKFAKVNGDLLNAVIAGEVPLNATPERENPEDVSTAEIYERLREVIDYETGASNAKRDLGFWMTYTGNAAVIPRYDYSEEYGTQAIPEYTCSNPACASGASGGPNVTLDATQPCPCGGPPPLPQAPPTLDPMSGQPVAAPPPPPVPPYNQSGTQQMPIGKLCHDILSPFEWYWDNTIRVGTGKHRWFIRNYGPLEISTAKKNWPNAKIEEGMSQPYKPSRNYLIAIAYAGSFMSGTGGTGEASARQELKNKVIPWELYELPSVEYPKGAKMVMLGSEVVELGPLPNQWGAGRLQGIPFLPHIHFFQELSGGAWGRARANSLWPIQARRNIIESNLQLTAQRTGSPKLLEPVGSGLMNVSGEAGQRLQYKPINFGGAATAKPEYLESALGNVQPLQLLLDKLDENMEYIAGTHFVTGADVPSGVTAACMDDRTEALTRNGWKTHDRLSIGEDIYCLDMETGKGDWSPIKNLHVYPDYDGPLHKYDGRDLSFAATPNHGWPTRSRYRFNRYGDETISRVRMDELNHCHFLLSGVPLTEKQIVVSNAEVEMIGWIATEGGYTAPSKKRRTRHWNVRIYQSSTANFYNCWRIRACLKAQGIPFKEYPRKNGMIVFYIYGAVADKIVSKFPDKRPTLAFISKLTREQADLLVETMILGDGCTESDWNSRVYGTSDPVLAEEFQFAATMAGYSTALREQIGGNGKTHISKRSSDNFYWITPKRAKHYQYGSLIDSVELVNHKGLVWCPETRFGTWVARRTGKVMATCNSALAFL